MWRVAGLRPWGAQLLVLPALLLGLRAPEPVAPLVVWLPLPPQ